MNKEEIKKQIEDCKKEFLDKFEEIKKEIYNLEKEEEKFWTPKMNEKYYYLNSCGEIYDTFWKNNNVDNFKLSQGNVFKTKKEAEEYLFKLELEGKARALQRETNEPIDWGNVHHSKYYIYYNYKAKEVLICNSRTYNFMPKLGYFTNEDVTNKFIEDNKEDLIRYFKGKE